MLAKINKCRIMVIQINLLHGSYCTVLKSTLTVYITGSCFVYGCFHLVERKCETVLKHQRSYVSNSEIKSLLPYRSELMLQVTVRRDEISILLSV